MNELCGGGVFGLFGSYSKSTVFGGFRNALSRSSPGVSGRIVGDSLCQSAQTYMKNQFTEPQRNIIRN